MLPNSMLGSDFLYTSRSLRSSSILESNSKDFFDTSEVFLYTGVDLSDLFYDRYDFRCFPLYLGTSEIFLLLEPILLYTRIEL